MLLACFGGREKNKNQFDQNDVREKIIFFILKKNIFVKKIFLGYGWRPAWSYSQSESGSKWR